MFFIVVALYYGFGGLVVRDAAVRRKRFIAGLDPDKIAANLRKQKDSMVEQETVYFAEISVIESKAKRIAEDAGVSSMAVAQYVNVARKCYSLAKKHKGTSLRDEAQWIVNQWTSRGFNPTLLCQVCNLSGCGTVEPSPYAPAPPSAFGLYPQILEHASVVVGYGPPVPPTMELNPQILEFPFVCATPVCVPVERSIFSKVPSASETITETAGVIQT